MLQVCSQSKFGKKYGKKYDVIINQKFSSLYQIIKNEKKEKSERKKKNIDKLRKQ